MGEHTVGRIKQLTLAHKSARPKHSNPAWMNTHRDLGIALKEIERLCTDEVKIYQEALENIEILTDRSSQVNKLAREALDSASNSQGYCGQ